MLLLLLLLLLQLLQLGVSLLVLGHDGVLKKTLRENSGWSALHIYVLRIISRESKILFFILFRTHNKARKKEAAVELGGGGGGCG